MSELTIIDKILAKEIPATVVYEDDKVLAFLDIIPQAKTHLLFVHKEKTVDINDMAFEHPEHFTDLFKAIGNHTKESGLDKTGFRIVTNLGQDSGQTIFYTHLHVLGGEKLRGFGS